MYPHERSLVEEMKDRPFALIGVNSDSSIEKAKAAIEKNNLNWRSFQNKPEGVETPISTTWSIQGWPTIVILDADRKIAYRGHDGMAATEVAEGLVAAMEKKAEESK
ncbi:MAG: hypothetical protein ACI841_004944 [Planctomycetota bacterium]|jgi:hypothetical protein